MNISVLGGGAWGTTLAQVLAYNGHNILIYEINQEYLDSINNGIHPIFKSKLPNTIKATNSLKDLADFSNIIQISIPSRFIRNVLKDLSQYINKKTSFINTSKGIETETFKSIHNIVEDEIGLYLDQYACLTGPSHAEETYLRRLTCLVSASFNKEFNVLVQKLYFNKDYIRVYTTKDVIGAEMYGASKNAIAIITGAITSLDLGENLRAAIITRGLLEISRLAEKLGGKKETAYGLSGLGDLLVTALSTHSRNFNCGLLLGKGMKLESILEDAKQTIEGVEAIKAFYKFSITHNVDLPLINTAYKIIFENLEIKEAIKTLLLRDLKSEDL